MSRQPQPLRIAIDTGGTFTDCIWMDPTSRRLRMLKVFSTPSDPSQAIVEAVRKISSNDDFILLHGTTVGTNTLLERKGARIALVTTQGFEDGIEIGRQSRPKLYDFFFDRIEPLVSKDLRFGVNERVAADGEILAAPASEQLRALADQISAANPESIAISLIFSFANPANEQAVAATLTPLKLPLSISHQILPEFREYERTSTVAINAYLQPVMQRYLESLARRVHEPLSPAAQRRISAEERPLSALKAAQESEEASAPEKNSARIFVMQSSGGITALSIAAREPVRTVLSGPAGGVVGAAAAARASGFENIITFDMGGTSTDVSLVEGEMKLATDAHIAGLPIGLPMLDIHTVGAGGGSLARFDAAGALRVGPESAGADPGPICYGRGFQPTVTDANLLLGRLQPTNFLGGDFILDRDRTRRITQEWLKKNKSTLSCETFAAGVIRIVNATMEKAIRVVSIERGRDPRQFALVAFGGAGGLHACSLAEALSIPQVIIPAMPGALSALGILTSDVVRDYSRTILLRADKKIPAGKLSSEFSKLGAIAAQDFRRESWQGRVHYTRSIDLRYSGQGYELTLPLTKNLLKDFQQEHHRRYGYTHPNRQIEIVTLRLRATMESLMSKTTIALVEKGALVRPSRMKLRRLSPPEVPVLLNNNKLKTKIYCRDQLCPNQKLPGPAIITEYSATTVIPPAARFHVDYAANLIVNIR